MAVTTPLPFLSLIVVAMQGTFGIDSSGVFMFNQSLNQNTCKGDALLSSTDGLKLFHCINICSRSKYQSCVGVFYKENQQRCNMCRHMDSGNLAPLAGTVAVTRQECPNYLVQAVNESQISASSDFHGLESTYSRLDLVETSYGTGCWIPATTDPDPYIQVDFLELKRIRGIVTQGRSDATVFLQWVTEYRVLTSTDCTSWEYVTDRDGNIEYFPGNSDQETHVTNLFDIPLVARCLRVNPTQFEGHPALRFDVLGCDQPSTR